ncbi:hypothetical protein OUZ56_015413 [Daphnia magna]|uniref:Hexosyltransferase n=1 Tax=Daphnia magna TaxID=35525 RepID=A0ABR0AMS0_9CRUS|nr:hypothetical protein OUZ56_015413 [Daphnia magna]
MIQIEMPDSGSLKQSLKMAGLLHWLHTNCAHMHFLLKVEDHVYVSVRNLANFATQYRPRFNDSMFGTSPSTFATKRAPVNSSHSYEEWPWSHYPPHLLDHAVLLANSTILPLLAAIKTTPRVVIDHLYYTGICREKAAIRIGNSSTNSSSILATNLPENPTPCYLRQCYLRQENVISLVAYDTLK